MFGRIVITALVTGFPLATFAAPAEKAAASERVCEVRPVTGSRVRSQRICMSRADWQRHRESVAQDMRQSRAMGGTSPYTDNVSPPTFDTVGIPK